LKVAIWGSYNYGNFGDDLMAVMLSKHFTAFGAEPVVYRLDNNVAEYYHIKNTYSIDSLLKEAKFCVVGGGNFLQAFPSLEYDWEEFLNALKQYSIPVHMISVGGDGSGLETVLTHYQRKFLEYSDLRESTVRLLSDLAVLSRYSKQVTIYPDIVFSTGYFWPLEEKSNYISSHKLRVGLNLPKSRKITALAKYLNVISHFNDVEFYFFSTHQSNYSVDYEFLPIFETPAIRRVTYSNLDSIIDVLSSLDLLISSKLHLGIAALSSNVPFYSLGGASKTQSLLKELNCRFAILSTSRRQYINLARILSSKNSILKLCQKFDFEAINSVKKKSMGHLFFVEDLVKRYS
jgi:polysaccharide pyruvyl transferase WcaK-like protein